MAVVAFHRHRHLAGVAPMLALDALEELTETFRTVDDLELFEQLAVGQADGYSVLTATDIDANAQNTMVDRLGFRSAR